MSELSNDRSGGQSRFVTTAEVADFYRTSPETVRYWRHIGYGPVGRKVGRRVLYERREVEAFWDTLKDASPAPAPGGTTPPGRASASK